MCKLRLLQYHSKIPLLMSELFLLYFWTEYPMRSLKLRTLCGSRGTWKLLFFVWDTAFLCDPIHLFKRHFELLVASLRLEMQKPIAIKSHKTNSSCESQLQRELLAYESMEGITFVTYQFTHIVTRTLHE